jgi:hypothetical protein
MLPRPEAVVSIEMQAMYSAVYLEKFAQTETAGYSSWAFFAAGLYGISRPTPAGPTRGQHWDQHRRGFSVVHPGNPCPCYAPIGQLLQPTSLWHQISKSICQSILYLLFEMQISRCLPGGHIGYQIALKIAKVPPQPTPLCHQTKINQSVCSLFTVWTAKFKMTAWRPYWISYFALKINRVPTPLHDPTMPPN